MHRRTDKLPAGALLASVGGFLDAYTLIRYGVFANLQSGNVVPFCVQVTSWHLHLAALRLVPVGAFIIGALAVELLGTPRAVAIVRRPIRLVLTIQIALLTVLATLPGNVSEPVTTVTVAFVAALQFSTFTTLHGAPYATLMTTGNLRQCVAAVHQWPWTPPPDRRSPAGVRTGGCCR
jgi:uncharacterized membrane protein YoaK (UPF0700 family)